MSSCSVEIKQIATRAGEIFRDYRYLIMIINLTFINVFLGHMEKQVVMRFAVYKHLKPETCQEIGMRMLQLVFGTINAVSGIGFLLYFLFSGCNIFNIYLFFIAGMTLVFTDLHEYVARWPLRPALLTHHLMTFVLALAIVEFEELPSNDEKELDWASALFLTNIGLMWVVDFYHVVYRTSTNLALIKKLRKIYLVAAVIRIMNIVLIAGGSYKAASYGSWFGSGCLLFMCLAYSFNSYKAIMFVARFDCDKYYAHHQALWFANLEDKVIKGWLHIAFLPQSDSASLQDGVSSDSGRFTEMENVSGIDKFDILPELSKANCVEVSSKSTEEA